MEKGGVKIKATKIRMHDGMKKSNSVLEIKDIYITGAAQDKYYPKENVHDFIENHPNTTIKVDIYPYPKLIAATKGSQKYVRSEANDSIHDNLLKLPRV
ncbi:DUF3892 domain-containing protein [Erysipelothrix rhusiopathiae]|nr:DUF3892 domain-containing protein [Erysipelothrix rhusiopathiae]